MLKNLRSGSGKVQVREDQVAFGLEQLKKLSRQVRLSGTRERTHSQKIPLKAAGANGSRGNLARIPAHPFDFALARLIRSAEASMPKTLKPPLHTKKVQVAPYPHPASSTRSPGASEQYAMAARVRVSPPGRWVSKASA